MLYLTIGFSAFAMPKIFKKRLRIAQFCVLFLFLFLVLALRHPSMGADLSYGDYFGYLGRYEAIYTKSFKELFLTDIGNYEKGYIFFNKIISFVSFDTQWLIVCCAFVSLLPVFIIYRKYSESFEFSLIIYLSLSCFLILYSGLRQSIAIGLCLISFVFVKNKKLVPFLLLVFIAFLFHKSAIIFALAYPSYHIRIKKQNRPLTIGAVVLIFILRAPIFNLLAIFYRSGISADNNGAFGLFTVFLAIYIFCSVFSKDNKTTNGYLNLFLLAVICQLFGNLYSIAGRMGFYFMPFLGLLLPRCLNDFKGTEKTILTFLIVSIFTLYGLVNIYRSGNSWPQAYPWIPFWDNNF